MEKTEKLQAAMQQLEDGIRSLTNSESWTSYLKFHSTFHQYSFNNRVMIWLQMPNASLIAGFGAWKKIGRFVKKGEKGLVIFAPNTITKMVEEKQENGEVTQKPKRIITGYHLISVFDVSQTDGKALSAPDVVRKLEGETDLYDQLLSSCPFPVEEKESCDGANGRIYRDSGKIEILQSNSGMQKAKTLIHEWAHGILHIGPGALEVQRHVRELEAESTAFIVCHALGIDSSHYSFGYLAGWGNGESAIEDIRKAGERILSASNKILAAIFPDHEMKEAV
ncbi:ArdC family protein [Paenibacillus luteus]|uniref:ArdC family protein n=1 Tax=Paenibacillus luteus TaxID=2545753 RepID=UPI001143BF21|nr:ArdC family protein [Paenibacillus luteus]